MARLIEINLLPIEDRKVKKDRSYLLDAKIVAPTLMLAITAGGFWAGKSYFNKQASILNDRLASLQTDVTQNSILLGKIKELEKLLKANNAKNHSLKSINVNRELWIALLQSLSGALPENMWLLDVRQENAEQFLVVQGATHTFSEVAAFIVNLEKCEEFKEVRLESVELDPSRKSNAFSFKLRTEIFLERQEKNQPPPARGAT